MPIGAGVYYFRPSLIAAPHPAIFHELQASCKFFKDNQFLYMSIYKCNSQIFFVLRGRLLLNPKSVSIPDDSINALPRKK